jgi:Uma2 family endonuclease
MALRMTTSIADKLPPTHDFSVEVYHRMGEAGLFEAQRVELIAGKIYDRSPISPKHASTVKRLANLLRAMLGEAYLLSVQDPVLINDYSEPEPDLATLRHRDDFYAESHPAPQDILLIIEVADSSLEKDRALKLPLYAEAGIPELWIVNLPGQQLERYWAPSARGYSHRHTLRSGETLEHELLGRLEVDVVLGRQKK